MVFLFVCLFVFNLWLCWVFVSVRGLSLVAASGGHSSSQCAGLSLSRPLLLWSTGSRHAGSAIVAHGPSCSTACGIFPDQGSNPCPLHWQADSQPLRHQGSPQSSLLSVHGCVAKEPLLLPREGAGNSLLASMMLELPLMDEQEFAGGGGAFQQREQLAQRHRVRSGLRVFVA